MLDAMPGKRDRTRAQLVAAAMEVVAAHGFHGASVGEICRRAGLSTGALYGNFSNKDALLFAVFEEHLRWFEENLEAVASADDVRAGLRRWLDAIDREPEQFLVFVEFWAYAVRRPALRRRLAKDLDVMRRSIAERIGTRPDLAGTPLAAAPALAAQVTMALVRGLAFEKLADAKSVSDADLDALVALATGAPASAPAPPRA